MPTVNQLSVFDLPPSGVHKIVIATNIAETRQVIYHSLQNVPLLVNDYT